MIRWTGLIAVPFVGLILAFTIGPFMGARRGALYFPSKKRPLSLYAIGFSWAVLVPFVLTMVFRTFLGPTFIFGITELLISLSLFLLIFSSFLLGVSSTKVFTIKERLDGMGWDDDLDDFTEDKGAPQGIISDKTKDSELPSRTKTFKEKSSSKKPTSKSTNSKKKIRKVKSTKESDFLESLEDKKEDKDSHPSVFSVLAQKRRQK